MGPADSIQVPRDWTYSGTEIKRFRFHLQDCHPLWSAFPYRSVIVLRLSALRPTTPEEKLLRFGLFPVRSPLLRKSIFLSFPAGT